MGRYLELAQLISVAEPTGTEVADDVGEQRYDRNDINDKRSGRQHSTRTYYTPLGQAVDRSRLPPETLDAEDWRAFFTERSAILEHDGGLSREKADRLAYESCVVAMTWVMTSDYPDDRCSACGSHLGPPKGVVLADHAVVCNSVCHRNHMGQQRERAERQLADMGITKE